MFNESLLTIDNFLGISLNGFMNNAPKELTNGEKYIITNGEYKNHICYIAHESKGVSYFLPQKGALFFLLEKRNFILYNGANWEEIQFNSSEQEIAVTPSVSKNFTGIDDTFDAPNHTAYLYLYLNSNTTLKFEQVEMPEITIMIKQCYNASMSLIWPDNILWQNKSPHQMTQTPNATDIIKLYRLPETTHFLGVVIAQNFQF
ncbi:MAG: DUF2793 domain-containing protein [Rickettsiaceae bacterium]|nr:DUF2793 domain-containing protein [Rickettsiaceae bacterium]